MDFTVRHINTIHSSALREQINPHGEKKLKNIESPYLKFKKRGKWPIIITTSICTDA